MLQVFLGFWLRRRRFLLQNRLPDHALRHRSPRPDVEWLEDRCTPTISLSGIVFEDLQYGGGSGRSFLASNGIVRPGARVELYDASGNFLASEITDPLGRYLFSGLASSGVYFLRAVNSSVTSSRPGSSAGLLGVQTFRTDASSGSVLPDTQRIGGENPALADASANTSNLNLATLGLVQSLTMVNAGSADFTGLDFGFNFSTIVNTNDTGQGSLRQFIHNANALGNAGLAQEGLIPGLETSIFMISDGLAHPGMQAGLTNQLVAGVATLRVTSTNLPALTDPDTVLDGTTQTRNVGNTNAILLGIGGTVGIGPDGLPHTGDETPLARLDAPEIEILDANNLTLGLDLQANNLTVRGLALSGFGNSPNNNSHAGIRIGDFTGTLIENNLLGSRATSFTDPGSANRTDGDNVRSVRGDNGIIRNNLIGFAAGKGIGLEVGSNDWLVEGNEIRGNAIGHSNLDGIDVEGSRDATIRANLFADNEGAGIDSFSSGGGNLVQFNTITNNGIGTGSNVETPGVRLYGTSNSIERNLIFANFGAGILVTAASTANTFTRNSLFANGTILNQGGVGPSGQVGIDLLLPTDNASRGTAPFVTPNVPGGGSGGNALVNAPVLTSVVRAGNVLIVTGFARPGATIELFQADPSLTGFGQGQTYLATVVEGSPTDLDSGTGTYGPGPINGLNQGTDTTNRFQFRITLSAPLPAGNVVTATATVGGATSEFSGNVTVANPPPPVPTSDTVSIQANSGTNLLDLLANDDSPAGLPLNYLAATQGLAGIVTLLDPLHLTYTPATNFVGLDTFTYTVGDGQGGSAIGTVNLNVIAQPPVLQPDFYNIRGPSFFDVLANDVSPNNLPLMITGATTSGPGVVSINGSGLNYRPAANFQGVERIRYSAGDSAGNVGSAEVTVNVLPPFPTTTPVAPPRATNDTFTLFSGGSARFDVLANDTGESLRVTGVTPTQSGTLQISDDGQTVLYTPNSTFLGRDSFGYTVTDAAGNTGTATISVEVRPEGTLTTTLARGSPVILGTGIALHPLAEILPEAGSAATQAFSIVGTPESDAGAGPSETSTPAPETQARITGYVFEDQGNGLRDRDNPVRPRATVVLERKDSGTFAPLAATQTDAKGYYQFTGLEPGTYRVRYLPPPGETLTFPVQRAYIVELEKNAEAANRTFGSSRPEKRSTESSSPLTPSPEESASPKQGTPNNPSPSPEADEDDLFDQSISSSFAPLFLGLASNGCFDRDQRRISSHPGNRRPSESAEPLGKEREG